MAIDTMNLNVKDNPNLDILKYLLINQQEMTSMTEEYSALLDKHEKVKEQFQNTLTEEQKELYHEVVNCASAEEYQTGNEFFILGFKAAAQLLMECFR